MAHSIAPAVYRTHLFIELQEMRYGMLRETSRWNHALEEDASGQAGEWSRPHLPTVSIFGLVKLRAALDSRNVLIDLVASNIDDVARQTCAVLLTSAYIQVHELERIYKALTVRSSPVTPASTPSIRPNVATADEDASLAPVVPTALQLPAAVAQAEGAATSARSPKKSPLTSPSRDPDADQNQDLFHLLDPDVGEEVRTRRPLFAKRSPRGAISVRPSAAHASKPCASRACDTHCPVYRVCMRRRATSS